MSGALGVPNERWDDAEAKAQPTYAVLAYRMISVYCRAFQWLKVVCQTLHGALRRPLVVFVLEATTCKLNFEATFFDPYMYTSILQPRSSL